MQKQPKHGSARPVRARVAVVLDVRVLVEHVDLPVEDGRREHVLVGRVDRAEEGVPRPVGHHQQEDLLEERVPDVRRREDEAEEVMQPVQEAVPLQQRTRSSVSAGRRRAGAGAAASAPGTAPWS